MNETILISIVLIFIYIFLFMNRNNLVYVESNTGAKFLVHKDKDKREKANLLSEIVENLFKLKNYVIKKDDEEYREYWKLLRENFTEERTTIYETDPKSDLTSYSVNKGEELAFCLKSKKNGKLHDLNLLMYVAIHEMAHMACPEIGHGDLFKKIFRKLTIEALNIGVYKKVDFESNPVEYCGMVLSSSII